MTGTPYRLFARFDLHATTDEFVWVRHRPRCVQGSVLENLHCAGGPVERFGGLLDGAVVEKPKRQTPSLIFAETVENPFHEPRLSQALLLRVVHIGSGPGREGSVSHGHSVDGCLEALSS